MTVDLVVAEEGGGETEEVGGGADVGGKERSEEGRTSEDVDGE